MNKTEFMKKIKKEIAAIPKYTNSTQIEAIANQRWNEYHEEVIEVTKELEEEEVIELSPKKQKRNKKK